MTTERIDIQVREDGSRVVKRNLDDIGNSADRAAGFIKTMGTVLAAVASAGAIAGLLRMADTYTNIQNKLRLVTNGTENLITVQKELLGIANQTRTDLEATSELYARVAGATKEMGLSQKQTLQFVKSLNQAVVLSGASAEEAAGGIRQLSQGLASGTLRGDELNSVMENFPKVADIIAESMGKSRGEIRKLGADGKITADIIIEAFAKAADKLDQEFATTVPTVSQSFTVLKNNLLSFVGEMNNSLGITETFSKLILVLANNLDVAIPIVLGLGAAIATAFAPTVIAMFTAQLQGLWALIAAHPIGALVVAIVGVTTALYAMRDSIKLGIDETTTLGDLLRAAWESIGPILSSVADTVKNVWGFITDTVAQALNNVTDNTREANERQEAWWLKLVRFVVQVFDMIGGTIRGVMAGVAAVVQKVIAAMMNNFEQLGNAIKGAMDLDGDAVLNAVKSNLAGWKEAGTDIGKTFGDAFAQEQLSQADSGLEAMLDTWIKRAQEIGKDRLAGAALGSLGGGGTGRSPIDEEAAKKAAEALKRLQESLNGLLDSIYPVDAAKRQLKDAQELLTKSVAAGLITQEKANQAYEDMKVQLRDQLDPLGALNRELDKSIELLKMSAGQRQIEAELYQMTQQLQREGVKLTTEEVAALRAKLTVEQELARISQARDSMWAESGAGQFAEFQTNVEAMKQLLADAQSGFGMGDIAGQLQKMLPWANLEATQEQMAGYVQAHADMYEQIRVLEEASIINSQTAGMLRAQADQKALEQRLNYTRQFFGALAQLSTSENKKLAQIGKAAAIVQATIDGVLAVQKTMAETPYPYNIPLAAAQAAIAAANVAQIASTGFRTGGTMTVGGSGGSDSQLVAFRATPGEKVSVNTPAQARALEQGAGTMPEVTVPVTVVNVKDPNEVPNALRDNPDSKNAIINMLAEDPAAFKQALNLNA